MLFLACISVVLRSPQKNLSSGSHTYRTIYERITIAIFPRTTLVDQSNCTLLDLLLDYRVYLNFSYI